VVDEARFWRHVSLLDDSCDACWIWVGAIRDDGRGRYFVSHTTEIRAHWAAWEIQNGKPVPKGYRLEQECNHPDCVRHWRLAGKRRKLSPKAVRDVLTSTLMVKELAQKYGVSRVSIHSHRRRAVLA
jgi:hypothetical protein